MSNYLISLKRTMRGFLLAILSVVAVGCATLGNPENNVDTSVYDKVTGVDAVKALEKSLKQSETKKLNVFAPKHYSTADKALSEARSLISKNVPREKVVQKVAVADAVLRNGDLVMRKVKDILGKQLVAKKKLDLLKAKKTYSREYSSLEDRLSNIIREIEDGNALESEQSRDQLLADMQKLEQRSVRYNAMHEPEEILNRVKYSSGEELAPITYQDALAVFRRADEFIKLHPGNYEAIKKVGKEALFAAKRALHITEQVAALTQKVKYSLEQVVLDEEYRLYRVARELGSKDLRDHPLEMQSEQLAVLARDKAEEYQNKDGLIMALRDTLIKVRDSSSQLAALGEASSKLKQDKANWLKQESRLKARISHLEDYLNQSQAQLDKTQQKLLAMKDDNKKLSLLLAAEKEQIRIAQTNKAKAESPLEVVADETNSKDASQTPLSKTVAMTSDSTVAAQVAPIKRDEVSQKPAEMSQETLETATVEAVPAKTENNEQRIAANQSKKSGGETVVVGKIVSQMPNANKVTMKKETMKALNSVLELIKEPTTQATVTQNSMSPVKMDESFVEAGE
ncbi:MAG TPA: hypothetical protein ENK06_01970 [Gammaproteobacteria bacterium]|nr:hypothetical protein [Gammaproteobacteria bacterium]